MFIAVLYSHPVPGNALQPLPGRAALEECHFAKLAYSGPLQSLQSSLGCWCVPCFSSHRLPGVELYKDLPIRIFKEAVREVRTSISKPKEGAWVWNGHSSRWPKCVLLSSCCIAPWRTNRFSTAQKCFACIWEVSRSRLKAEQKPPNQSLVLANLLTLLCALITVCKA